MEFIEIVKLVASIISATSLLLLFIALIKVSMTNKDQYDLDKSLLDSETRLIDTLSRIFDKGNFTYTLQEPTEQDVVDDSKSESSIIDSMLTAKEELLLSNEVMFKKFGINRAKFNKLISEEQKKRYLYLQDKVKRAKRFGGMKVGKGRKVC